MDDKMKPTHEADIAPLVIARLVETIQTYEIVNKKDLDTFGIYHFEGYASIGNLIKDTKDNIDMSENLFGAALTPKALTGYIAVLETLDKFLDDIPSIGRENND